AAFPAVAPLVGAAELAELRSCDRRRRRRRRMQRGRAASRRGGGSLSCREGARARPIEQVNSFYLTIYLWFIIVGMEISHLRYFCDVAQSGSFAKGARMAHVSPPAMTKAIQRLETETGVRLFERTTRRVALTEEGKVVFRRAREVLNHVDEISRDLDELRT